MVHESSRDDPTPLQMRSEGAVKAVEAPSSARRTLRLLADSMRVRRGLIRVQRYQSGVSAVSFIRGRLCAVTRR